MFFTNNSDLAILSQKNKNKNNSDLAINACIIEYKQHSISLFLVS